MDLRAGPIGIHPESGNRVFQKVTRGEPAAGCIEMYRMTGVL